MPLVALGSTHGSVSENPIPSHCLPCTSPHVFDEVLFVHLYIYFVSFCYTVNSMRKKDISIYPWLHPQLPTQCLAYSKCLVNVIHFEWVNGWKKKCRLWGCRMLLLKMGSLNHSTDVFWKLARNLESQAPTHTYCLRICILTRFPGVSVGTSQFKEHWLTSLTWKGENVKQEELPALISKTLPTRRARWGKEVHSFVHQAS